ncbi:hypothetical protein HQ865_06080 [Mucilaginibacter mali]|uniref:YtxH domain-containing protein n=1 Tax=Mucilaginibacter mali TaxID=2740462 RepID=A0A7D4UL62_9SPHI|nr:hypothetical protein [Mucilaginibacter mali]QKJ29341.1 hypothetical protein HQ865_06080 [Mucilaginibacter mali]
MKNTYEKQDRSLLIGAIALGAAIAGGLAYLFLTESGTTLRGKMKSAIKEKGKDVAANALTKKTGVPKNITKAAANTMLD